MAKREILDEEPFDIDLDTGDDEDFSFDDDELSGKKKKPKGDKFDDDDDDADLDDVDAEEDDEEEEAPKRKRAKGVLSDEDLDDYEDLKNRTEAAEAAAASAVEAARAIQADRVRGAVASEKQAIETARNDLKSKIAAVREKLKTAFEEADSDAHGDLSEELADLKGQQRLLEVYAEQAETRAKTEPQVPKTHPKATAWLKKNGWFNSNDEARIAAVGYANTLEAQGILPSSDEYYKKVDAHMKRRYPELFEERRKDIPAVRQGERSGSSAPGKKRIREVKLTGLQVQLSRKWGIPKENMAKEVLRQQKRDSERESR